MTALSQQRRRDRYLVIYMWKILEGHYYSHCNHTPPRGLVGSAQDKTYKPGLQRGYISTLLTSSLTYEGPKTFNALPKEVRSITGCPVRKFKSGVDKFLLTVPDKPPVPRYSARYRTHTISDQVDLRDWDARIGSRGGPPWL